MTSQSKAVLWVLGVFVTGAVFGGAISYFAARPPLPPPESVPLFEPAPEQPQEPAAGPPAEPNEVPRGLGSRPGGRGGPPGDRHRPVEEMRRLARFLQLTPEQYGQLREILAQTMQRYQEANKDHRIRQHQIRSDMMRSLRVILTPEQKERLDGFIKERRQRWRLQQGRRRGNPPGQ